MTVLAGAEGALVLLVVAVAGCLDVLEALVQLNVLTLDGVVIVFVITKVETLSSNGLFVTLRTVKNVLP